MGTKGQGNRGRGAREVDLRGGRWLTWTFPSRLLGAGGRRSRGYGEAGDSTRPDVNWGARRCRSTTPSKQHESQTQEGAVETSGEVCQRRRRADRHLRADLGSGTLRRVPAWNIVSNASSS